MATCPPYVNTLKAEFGRTISSEGINAQFEAIERTMACIENKIVTTQQTTTTVYDYGTVDTSLDIDPSLGALQRIMLEGDVELTMSEPGANDPKFITLLLGDAGSGRFNFPAGGTWVSDSEGSSMDGKPWDNDGLGGDYGAMVFCIHDGAGWLFLCFSRNDVDTDGTADTNDLANWR